MEKVVKAVNVVVEDCLRGLQGKSDLDDIGRYVRVAVKQLRIILQDIEAAKYGISKGFFKDNPIVQAETLKHLRDEGLSLKTLARMVVEASPEVGKLKDVQAMEVATYLVTSRLGLLELRKADREKILAGKLSVAQVIKKRGK